MKGRRVRLLTVTGPGGAVDVALAADAALRRVTQLMISEVGGGALPPDDPRWALYDEAGRVLAPTSTLVREGVVDGDVLQLSGTGRPAPFDPARMSGVAK